MLLIEEHGTFRGNREEDRQQKSDENEEKNDGN